MKKWIALLLTLTLAVGLFVGCSTQSNGGEEPANNNSGSMADATLYNNDTLLEGLKQLSSRSIATLTASDPRLDTVVATCAGSELDNRMMQFYYWMEYLSFLNNYGSYLSYLGLDTSKPLSEQQSFTEGLSWEQYFLESAIAKFQTTAATAAEAEKNGYKLPEELEAQIANVPEELKAQAGNYGFPSGDSFLQATFGPTVTVDGYVEYLRQTYLSSGYQNELYGQIDTSKEAVAAYFRENQESFADSGVSLDDDTTTINVRHILIKWEDSDNDNSPSDEEKAAAREQAEAILAEYQKNPTEQNFADLANQYSTDGGSNTNGGLYENVYTGQMVEAFNNWCFDPIRVTGDTGIVETGFGYHIMYFVGRNDTPCWMQYALDNGYASAAMQQKISDITHQYDFQVALDLIVLGTPAMYSMTGQTEETQAATGN